MLAIFKKEFKSYFINMTGYCFISFFIFITALFFSLININNGLLDYQSTLMTTVIMFLILVPILTMRLFSEESKNKTDQLLLTSPISIFKITFGKYLASISLFFLTLLATIIFPFILSFYGKIAVAHIFCTYLGYFLLGSCFISIGIFLSTLSENQIVVSISTFGSIFLFYILDSLLRYMPSDKISSLIFITVCIFVLTYFIQVRVKTSYALVFVSIILEILILIDYFFKLKVINFDSLISKSLNWFSLMSRFNNFISGILSLSDIFYYISFIVFFILLTVNSIERKRF
ncbi:MAG: ABC transporter permease [Clostridiales bacterium]|nr:ABC transporter permease [Clostridiales bacterium]